MTKTTAPKLTEAQQIAYDTIKRDGTLYSGNGVSHATIKVLERLGLVTVERSVHTWINYRSWRNHSQLDWSAKLAA